MYPKGLSLYFDLYSIKGYLDYIEAYLLSVTTFTFGFYTIFPLNVWYMILTTPYGADWPLAICLYLTPFFYILRPLCWLLPCPIEDNWNTALF